jgi:hypothetical protein
MGVDVFRHLRCPKRKLFGLVGVGDNAGNIFKTLYSRSLMNGLLWRLMFKHQHDAVSRYTMSYWRQEAIAYKKFAGHRIAMMITRAT